MNPFVLVAQGIASANPYYFIPQFVNAPYTNAHQVDYAYPAGHYTSSITSNGYYYQG